MQSETAETRPRAASTGNGRPALMMAGQKGKQDMKFLGKFAAFLAAAVLAGSPIRTTSRYDVTVDVGICDNANQDGHVIAAYGYDLDPQYDYIAYRCTDAKPGDVVLTICYITPGSVDDIVQRVDYIISPTL